MNDPYSPPAATEESPKTKSIGATDIGIAILFVAVSFFSLWGGFAVIFFYAISRNSLKDRYAGQVNTKQCINCGRELGGQTAICPKCEKRQPVAAIVSPSNDRDEVPTVYSVATEFCDTCNVNVTPDEDFRRPQCKWPI